MGNCFSVSKGEKVFYILIKKIFNRKLFHGIINQQQKKQMIKKY